MVQTASAVKKESLALIAYLVVSARQLFEEPKKYGAFRLTEACSRLIEFLDKRGVRDESLAEVKSKIEANKFKMLTDENQFIKFLDDLVLSLVARLDEDR